MTLVVSLRDREFGALARRALVAAKSADMIELRLDSLTDVSEAQLGPLFAELGVPAIVAVNGPEAHGTFAGAPSDRAQVYLRAARAGAAFVDIDWRHARDLPKLPKTTRRIVSRHGRAPAGQGATWLEELRSAGAEGDQFKLVLEARTTADGLEVLSLLNDAPQDLIAFASGTAGSFTRVLAPILGSRLTYAACDAQEGFAGEPTAPGQLTASELRAAWPVAGPKRSTQIFAVLGQPISHSVSPRVHTRALRELELDAVFVAMEIDDLSATLDACAAPNWRGFAVTAPHKRAAFTLATQHDESCRTAGAANTLIRVKSGWRAANSDIAGVRGALLGASGKESLQGKRALVLGAGGAARAALAALAELGACATVCARDMGRAQLLAREFKAATLPWELRTEALSTSIEILVQCTPVGQGARESLIPEDAIPRGAIVIESVYRPAETALLAAALRRGASAVPGSEWFAHQAAQQFEWLTNREAPVEVLREELRRALA